MVLPTPEITTPRGPTSDGVLYMTADDTPLCVTVSDDVDGVPLPPGTCVHVTMQHANGRTDTCTVMPGSTLELSQSVKSVHTRTVHGNCVASEEAAVPRVAYNCECRTHGARCVTV